VVAVQLYDGSWTWVDGDTARRFARWNWRLRCRRGYVQITRSGERRRLHRAIIQAAVGILVHHRDGNPRHNWRANLVLCDRKQNAYVRRKNKNCRSRFTGIHWVASCAKWRAQIIVHGSPVSLGYFHTEEAAARARDRAVMLLRESDFWQLNFPEELN
jgi:hypothetical protein